MRKSALTGLFLLMTIALATACADGAPKATQATGKLQPSAAGNPSAAPAAYDNIQVQIVKMDNLKAASSRTVRDIETVAVIMNALSKIEWENAEVSMSRPPDYNLLTQHQAIDPDASDIPRLYEAWISPQQDQLEFVLGAQGQYGRLSAADSAKLLPILRQH